LGLQSTQQLRCRDAAAFVADRGCLRVSELATHLVPDLLLRRNGRDEDADQLSALSAQLNRLAARPKAIAQFWLDLYRRHLDSSRERQCRTKARCPDIANWTLERFDASIASIPH